jgi:hypothetical protein
MGREARSKPKPGRVTLSAEDYWKFRASINDVSAIELEATQAAAQFKGRIAEATARTSALFADLAKAHGFDPAKAYRWDDATCELIEATKA